MNILVAEDDRVSLKMLNRHLTNWGYATRCIEDGAEAWQTLRSEDDIHLAILDWNMPGLDGLALCRKIRADPDLATTYLILLTGRGEKDDLLQGFEAGADDYVVKPFDPLELSSRLKVGRRIVEQNLLLQTKNQELARYAHEMERLAEERARMLIHADRLASLGTLTAGMAHEINNPTTFISGNAQTLERIQPIITEALRNSIAGKHGNTAKVELVLEAYPKMIAGIRSGVSRIAGIVKGLQCFPRTGRNTTETFAVNDCLEGAMLICGNRLKCLEVIRELDEDIPHLEGDPQRIEQVFINMIVNAADALEEGRRAAPRLVIGSRVEGAQVVIEIRDNGPGIAEDAIAEIWKPFYTTKGVGRGTGLGLSISEGIVADHGGRIEVDRAPEGGARFRVRLPVPDGGER